MGVHPLVIKALTTVATDKRTWKFLAVLVTTLLTPVIFLTICVVMIFSSAQLTSHSVIEYSFSDKLLPHSIPQNERVIIKNMRELLSELEKEISKYKEKDSLDKSLVKAVFYCTHIGYQVKYDADGKEIPIDYKSFIQCFKKKTISDLPEISENLSEEFAYIRITQNQFTAIENAYTFIQ